MKWCGGDPYGLYRQDRERQLEVLGLLRELFGSPTSPAAVSFLLGVPRDPRSRPPGQDHSEDVHRPANPPTLNEDGSPVRSWTRPPWLIATSKDAARRGDMFRVS